MTPEIPQPYRNLINHIAQSVRDNPEAYADLIPNNQKGIPMSAYNGYTESDEKVKARFEARNRRHEEAMRLRQEAEAIPVLVTAEIHELELAE